MGGKLAIWFILLSWNLDALLFVHSGIITPNQLTKMPFLLNRSSKNVEYEKTFAPTKCANPFMCENAFL